MEALLAKVIALMSKMYSALPSAVTEYIPVDKVYHIIGGAIVALVAILAGFSSYAIAATAVVAFLKEMYDLYTNKVDDKAGVPHRHSADILDFVATVIGGVVVVTVSMLL